MSMTIYLGADHRGFALKEHLKRGLAADGFAVVDLGNEALDPKDDYPDFAARVAEHVSTNPGTRGILLCGSGVGVDIVANKFRGVRSALVGGPEQARTARSDDDTNVLSLAADHLTEAEAERIVSTWLETEFSGAERHKRRLQKITGIEERRP